MDQNCGSNAKFILNMKFFPNLTPINFCETLYDDETLQVNKRKYGNAFKKTLLGGSKISESTTTWTPDLICINLGIHYEEFSEI